MTIIVFLIDTSASMNVRCYLGGRPTLLDVAKGAVETFVKVRQRSPESRGDRYMLLSFEDPPNNIKAGWKENLATFMNELKNLRADGLTTMGPALKNAFDLLNINRMQSGIDTYGQGRCPFFLEPSVIVVVTDGGKLTSLSGIQEDFNLPMHTPIPGSELTREPFRWDQRLFSLVLRLSGTPAQEQNVGLVPSDNSPIDAMCEVTGGRSYCITSHRIMIQCIDSLVQKVQSGVVINFEKIGPEPVPPEAKSESDPQPDEFNELLTLTSPNCSQDTSGNGTRSNSLNSQSNLNSLGSLSLSLVSSPSAWHNCRRLIYVARSAQKGFAVGYWPIPENFWPDLNSAALPPRSAHPNVKFTCTSQEPMVIENLPFDKYELEPSPLTQYILARKQPTVCWQVFVANSYKNSEVGHPFGYLKASTNLTCVNLFVMPYNYPVLLPLLDELFKVHRLKPTNEWRTQFQNYLRTMPPYYAGPLKRALIRMSIPGSFAQTLIPDAMEISLSYSVLNYLKRLKNQAKSEFDRMCNKVGNKVPAKSGTAQEGARVLPRSPLKKELVSHPLLQDKFVSLREQLNEFGGFVVGIPQTSCAQQVYLNPGDIPRNQLVDQLNLLRDRFFNPKPQLYADEDNDHNLPVNQMGNYQEYLKRMPMPLREIESAPVRQHMFGNPFKIDTSMMVDEADNDVVASGSSPARGTKRAAPTEQPSPRQNNKRKPGPLPKDTVARRPSSLLVSSLYSGVNPSHIKNSKNVKKGIGKTNMRATAMPRRVYPESEHMPPKSFHSSPPKLLSIIDQDDDTFSSGDEGGNPKMPVIDEEVGFNYEAFQSPCQRETPDESNGDTDRSDEDSMESGFLKPNGPLQNGHSRMEAYVNKLDVYGLEPEVTQAAGNTKSSEESAKKDVNEEKKSESTATARVDTPRTESSLACNLEDREPAEAGGNVVAVEPAATESKAAIDAYNTNIRSIASMQVRKPGRRHGPLIEQLKTLKGNLDTRLLVVEDIISEAMRFKRYLLAGMIRDLACTNEFLCISRNGMDSASN